jgi:cytochrome bd-type quinol oxidase subunit 2
MILKAECRNTPFYAHFVLILVRPPAAFEMNRQSHSTKLKVALAAQAVFALVLIFYTSQTLLRHLQFGVAQPIADYLVQLIAIVVPPAMLLLSIVVLRSGRRAIQASIIAQLLVCLAAARLLVPELLSAGRGEGVDWAGRLLIVGSAPVALISLALAAIFCHHLAVTRHADQV